MVLVLTHFTPPLFIPGKDDAEKRSILLHGLSLSGRQ